MKAVTVMEEHVAEAEVCHCWSCRWSAKQSADATEELMGWRPRVEGALLILSTVEFAQVFQYLCCHGELFGARVVVEGDF